MPHYFGSLDLLIVDMINVGSTPRRDNATVVVIVHAEDRGVITQISVLFLKGTPGGNPSDHFECLSKSPSLRQAERMALRNRTV